LGEDRDEVETPAEAGDERRLELRRQPPQSFQEGPPTRLPLSKVYSRRPGYLLYLLHRFLRLLPPMSTNFQLRFGRQEHLRKQRL
jgi:hypothetical protein